MVQVGVLAAVATADGIVLYGILRRISSLQMETDERANGARYDSQGQATKERRPWTISVTMP